MYATQSQPGLQGCWQLVVLQLSDHFTHHLAPQGSICYTVHRLSFFSLFRKRIGCCCQGACHQFRDLEHVFASDWKAFFQLGLEQVEEGGAQASLDNQLLLCTAQGFDASPCLDLKVVCEVEHPPPRAEAVAEPGAPEVWSVEPAEEVGALLFELTFFWGPTLY